MNVSRGYIEAISLTVCTYSITLELQSIILIRLLHSTKRVQILKVRCVLVIDWVPGVLQAVSRMNESSAALGWFRRVVVRANRRPCDLGGIWLDRPEGSSDWPRRRYRMGLMTRLAVRTSFHNHFSDCQPSMLFWVGCANVSLSEKMLYHFYLTYSDSFMEAWAC